MLSGYFTTHRGKTKLTSEKQHQYMHVHELDHTHHMPNGEIIRHRFENGSLIRTSRFNKNEKKILGNKY